MPIRTRYVNIQFVPEFSIAHTQGNCKYRVVFAGKYCRKPLSKKKIHRHCRWTSLFSVSNVKARFDDLLGASLHAGHAARAL